MEHKKVLLFSGGIDSFAAWHYFQKPPTVYFNVKSRYSQRELAAVKALIPSTIIDNSLDLSDREVGKNAYIPFRNLLLACQAVKYSDHIVIAGLQDDMVSDKNEYIFSRFGSLLSEVEGRTIVVTSPFWDKTKEEVVRWYLQSGESKEELLKTFSCYAPYVSGKQSCGKCPACFRKWVALKRNSIDDFEFQNFDLMMEYYNAAKKGKYVKTRNEAIIKTVEERVHE